MKNEIDEKVEYLKQRVLSYCDSILNGEIVAGQKTKWAVERFYRDMENPKYYIDWRELLRFYIWAAMFKHTKGVVAGEHIKLADFQLFFATNIFCLKEVETDTRKYTEVYIQLGRKNAKSQFIAIVVSYVGFLSKEAEEIYVSCWTKDQSKLVYDETLRQIRQVKELKDKFTAANGKITVLKNGSIVKPLSREARNTGDGTNPSIAILDEYKDNKTSELYDTQKTGMIARKNPLLIVITTAGFNLNYPCYRDYQYYSNVLNPELDVENDSVFIAIYELDKDDDIKEEKNWIKANPLVATYEEGLRALRKDLKVAIEQPEKMRGFLTKNMNLWVDKKVDGYLDMRKWNDCQTDEYPDLSGWRVYLGLDLSMTTDLTSVGWVAVKDGMYAIGQHSFIPSDKFNERMSRDKVRYDLFETQGYLTVTDGAIINYSEVRDYILELKSKWNIIEVGFDKWNATHIAGELSELGVNMVEVSQSIAQLSLPTKEFREKVYSGKVVHDGDGLLKWAVNNAVLKQDEQENIMIGKTVSSDRIDPIASVINAFSLAMYDNKFDVTDFIKSNDFGF